MALVDISETESRHDEKCFITICFDLFIIRPLKYIFCTFLVQNIVPLRIKMMENDEYHWWIFLRLK